MANFCINCGTKLGKDDNYCINCGTKIDKSDIGYDTHFTSVSDSREKEKAKKELKRVVGGILYNNTFSHKLIENGLDIVRTRDAIKHQVEKEIESGQITSGGVEFRVNQLIQEHKIKKDKEKEEEKKKLKMIDEIFESEEIKSKITEYKIGQKNVTTIKDRLKNKLINKKENMSEAEIKFFIKTEFEQVRIEQNKARIIREEMNRKKMEKPQRTNGGYCSLNCRHYYEELFDSRGGIVGDYDDDGYVEYYCNLGHPISHGRFCEDYE